MSITKRVLLASGATLALASTVRAQAPQGSNQAEDVLLDHEAVHISPDGHHRKVKINETGAAMAKAHGQELSGHAMFYREGGKNYVVRDQKMADGTNLFDHSDNWEARF